jgi:hypothetical protein
LILNEIFKDPVLSGWPPAISFRRAANVGYYYAMPPETEKISDETGE